LERLYRRRVPVTAVISTELARACTELAHEMRREIGVLINRRGAVEHVCVGQGRDISLPDLSRYRSGPGRCAAFVWSERICTMSPCLART